jgi:hypothetical protein
MRRWLVRSITVAHGASVSVVHAVLFMRPELEVVEVRSILAFDFVSQPPVVNGA